MRKFLWILLWILLPSSTNAEVVKINDVYYNLDKEKGTAVVSNNGHWRCYSGNITIPEKLSYDGIEYVVEAIGNSAFKMCSELTSCKLPNTITAIGKESFYGCKKLLSIIVPDNVEKINEHAFYYSI